MAAQGTDLPPSTQPHAGNGVSNGLSKDQTSYPADTAKAGYVHPDGASKPHSGKVKSLLLAVLLAVAIALAAAPVSGYKSGWAYYRRSAYIVPAQYQIPIPVTLKIWVGWIKGTNSITNLLHSRLPARFAEYTYLRDVRESGQVVAGLAIAFLLLSAAVGFLYFLACLLSAMCGARKAKANSTGPSRLTAVPPGLWIAGLVFGFLNMAWSIACYIVIAVGTSIYTRRTLGATYVAWPDWCFFLAFFSGVFWLAVAALALSERRRTRKDFAGSAAPHGAMTHNMSYENAPAHGTSYNDKPHAVV